VVHPYWLSADGLGYRGGKGLNGANDGMQGESYTGLGQKSTAANGGGGGGGGYGTQGRNAVNGPDIPPAYGGNTYGSPSLTTLFIGSGGGSSGAQSQQVGADGGNGGGAISIQANTIIANGRVSANGADGQSRGTAANPRGGGGGSGGSIFLQANIIQINTDQAKASGGKGGFGIREGPTTPPASGGDGGDGRIHIEYCSSITGTTNPSADTKLEC
jgi:hypothetical protein